MSLLTAMFLSLAITTTTTTVLLLLTPAAATALQVMMTQLRRPSGSGGCFPGEMDALLEFKEGIADDTTGLLASWRPEDGQDCCRWTGVRCSDRTGHIVKLNLGSRESINPFAMRLFGEISHSLLSLHHLQHLDLSHNSLEGPTGDMPEFLGSLKSLRYLNLSGIPFHGLVPPHLGNLSNLRVLDLSYTANSYSPDISWVTRLRRLRYLNMGDVNLSMADYRTSASRFARTYTRRNVYSVLRRRQRAGTPSRNVPEVWGATSRSSPKHAAELIGKFDKEKSDLVRSIGFGGLLELPQINGIDRRFTRWLLSRVNCDSRTLRVGNNLDVELSPRNVHRVLGIPFEGMEVCPMPDNSKDEKDSFVQHYIGAPGFEASALKGAEEVIRRTFPDGMNSWFRTAFVVWIVGTFLAPKTSHKALLRKSKYVRRQQWSLWASSSEKLFQRRTRSFNNK
ncbi:hypothetical protein OsJ_34271 [Oryza sativa Japonica Group]|uniref:Leucine-rich repeat-containing N-terminal plant-type domain-containing protein n=1 Tax=Oryza sativa subsp. japonica TaxID=39947 RepID=B9GB77_ORYSJ|nr:hypothetical protein OsJ_34271 [Oryza sativa Japonica Group]